MSRKRNQKWIISQPAVDTWLYLVYWLKLWIYRMRMHPGWAIESWAVWACSKREDLVASLNRADVLLTKSRLTGLPNEFCTSNWSSKLINMMNQWAHSGQWIWRDAQCTFDVSCVWDRVTQPRSAGCTGSLVWDHEAGDWRRSRRCSPTTRFEGKGRMILQFSFDTVATNQLVFCWKSKAQICIAFGCFNLPSDEANWLYLGI